MTWCSHWWEVLSICTWYLKWEAPTRQSEAHNTTSISMAVTLVAYWAPKWIHAQESQLAVWAFLKGKGCLVVVASDKPFNNWMVGRGISEIQEKERGIKEWTLPHNIQPHWATNRGQASPMKGGMQREGLSVMKIGNRSGKGKTTSPMVCPCKRGCRGSIHNGESNNKCTHQCNLTTRSRLLVRAKVQEGEGLRASEGASTMESWRAGTTNAPTKVTRQPGQGYSWGVMCRGQSWWMFKILRGWRTCAVTCLDIPLSVSHRVMNCVKCAYLEWGQSARMVMPTNPLQDIGT